MGSITIPDLYCPIPSALNPHVSEAEEFSLTWADEFGIFPEARARKELEMSRLGHLSSYAYPNVSQEALHIMVAWLDWLMRYDDLWVDKRERVRRIRPGALAEFQRRVLDVLGGGPVDAIDDPLHRAMYDIRVRLLRLRPGWDMTEFLRGFGHYLQSNLWEITNIERGQAPRPPIYVGMRRHTGCLFPTYEMSCVLADIRLDRERRSHVAIGQLEIMANNYTCWLNDIYSVEREHADGTVNNLVLSLRRQYGTTLQEAVDLAAQICRTEIESYFELKSRLPQIGLVVDDDVYRYLAVLESWMRGLLDWSRMTQRYTSAPSMPA